MSKKILNLLLAALVAAPLFSQAHEGAHGPEQKMAPQGGKLEETSNLFLELLKNEEGVKVFAYTHASMAAEKKPLLASEVKVIEKKTTLVDRNKKPVSFKLEPQGDHFKLDIKGLKPSNRYELNLVVSYQGKEEKPVKWQIEPGSF